jgi:hypothetical protein
LPQLVAREHARLARVQILDQAQRPPRAAGLERPAQLWHEYLVVALTLDLAPKPIVPDGVSVSRSITARMRRPARVTARHQAELTTLGCSRARRDSWN